MAKNQPDNKRINLYFNLNGKEIENNIAAITKEKRKLYGQLNRLTVGTEEYNKKAGEIRQVEKYLKDVRTQVRGTGSDTQKTFKIFGREFKSGNGMINKMRGGLATLASGFIAAFAVDRIIQWAGELFNAMQRMRELNHEVRTLTGLTGEMAQDATAKIQALSGQYDKSSREIINAANSVSKAWGTSIIETLEMMQDGFLAGADINGEFLEQLREYPRLMQEAGLSQEQFFQIITQSVNEGVYSDKGIDAIKEAHLSIREMTDPTREAIEAIGLSADEIQKGLESGMYSMFDVIQMISERMTHFKSDSQEIGLVLADIWKGAGEDAGYEFLTMIHEVEGGLDDLVDVNDEYIAQKKADLELSERVQKAWQKLFEQGSALFELIRWGKERLAEFLELMGSDHLNVVEKFASVIGITAFGFRKLALEKHRAAEAQELYMKKQQEYITAEEEYTKHLNALRQEAESLGISIEGMSERQLNNAIHNKKEQIKIEKQAAAERKAQAEKAAQEALEQRERLEEKINDFLTKTREDRLLANLSADERELKAEELKYQQLIDQAIEFGLSIQELEAERDKALQEIEDRQKNEKLEKERAEKQRLLEEEQAFRIEFNEAIQSDQQNQIDAINRHYDNLVSQAEKYGMDTEALERARKDAIEEINKDIRKDEEETIQFRIQKHFELANAIGSIFGSLAMLYSQDVEFKKAMAVAQIAIDSAQAVASAIAAAASTSITPIDLGIKIASSTAIILANIARAQELLSSESMPEPYTPPHFKKGGVFQGSSHQQGGNAVIDSRTGRKIAEVEAGEPYMIFSKDLYKNNKPIIDALLDSSMNKGGMAIPWMQNVQPFNFDLATGAAERVSGNSSTSGQTAGTDSYSIKKLEGFLSKLNESLQMIEQKLGEPSVALLPNDTIDKMKAREDLRELIKKDAQPKIKK